MGGTHPSSRGHAGVRPAVCEASHLLATRLSISPTQCDNEVVSFDVFVQAFRGGVAGQADVEAVASVLGPHVRVNDRGHTHLETADGGADLYGFDDLHTGFMINHVSGARLWDLVVRAAGASGMAIMPVGCPVAVADADSIDDLPQELQRGARVVRTGEELQALIQGQQ